MGLDHGRSAMGLVLWWWLLGARLECKIAREIQQHVLRVGLVSYCCGLTLISTFPYPNFWSFLHNQTETEWKEGKKKIKNLGDLEIGRGRCPRCENGKCGSVNENCHWKESVSGARRGRFELGHGYLHPRDAPRPI